MQQKCVTIYYEWNLPFLKGSTYSKTVCSGKQLEVTCQTNGSVLSWSIHVPQFSEGTNKAIFETDPDNVTEVVFLGGIPFQFTKTVTLNSPLMSAVVVDGVNVTSYLNGTMVNCTGVNQTLMSTTILVIGNGIPTLLWCMFIVGDEY